MRNLVKAFLLFAVLGNCIYVSVTCYGLAFFGQTTAIEPNSTIAHAELIESIVVAISFFVFMVSELKDMSKEGIHKTIRDRMNA
jgi:hypothetical protein